MKLQCVITNKLVHQKPLFPCDAISDKRNEMSVMNSADDLDLGVEFTVALTTPGFELLDGYLFTIWKHSSVDITKSTLSEKIGVGEAISCPGKLLECEGALREAKRHTRRWGTDYGAIRVIGTRSSTAAECGGQWWRQRWPGGTSRWWWDPD